MRAKKAKAIRRAAREIATESGLSMDEEVFAEAEGRSSRTAVLYQCAPAVENKLKRLVKESPNLPTRIIESEGVKAAFSEGVP